MDGCAAFDAVVAATRCTVSTPPPLLPCLPQQVHRAARRGSRARGALHLLRAALPQPALRHRPCLGRRPTRPPLHAPTRRVAPRAAAPPPAAAAALAPPLSPLSPCGRRRRAAPRHSSASAAGYAAARRAQGRARVSRPGHSHKHTPRGATSPPRYGCDSYRREKTGTRGVWHPHGCSAPAQVLRFASSTSSRRAASRSSFTSPPTRIRLSTTRTAAAPPPAPAGDATSPPRRARRARRRRRA